MDMAELKRNIINFTRLIVIGVFAILYIGNVQAKDIQTQPKVFDIISELKAKLNQSGSFEARYALERRGKQSANLLLVYNAKLRYMLFKTESDHVPELNASMIYYLEKFEGADTSNYMVLTAEGAQRTNYSWSGLLTRLDNPAAIFDQILKLLEQEDLRYSPTEVGQVNSISPKMELGLTKENLSMGLGADIFSEQVSFSVSWLAPELLAKATSIQKNDDNYIFELDEEHTIHIDRQSGLLALDSYLSDQAGQKRKIKLLNINKTNGNKPFKDYFPGFNEADVKDTGFASLDKPMSAIYLTSAFNKFVKQDGLKRIKKLKPDSIPLAVVTSGYLSGLYQAHHNQNTELVENMLRKIIIPGYQVAQDQNGVKPSYKSYLQELYSMVEQDPSLLLENQKFSTVPLLTDMFSIINNLPEESKGPMLEFYHSIEDVFLTGFSNGYKFSHFQAAINKALKQHQTSEKSS